jgi:hypothetical protein
MFRRKGLALIAACAALACGGLVHAADTTSPVNEPNAAPVMADDNGPTVRRPLMAALDGLGAAKPLDAIGIDIRGYVEGSWQFDASHPTGNYFTGRAFDNEQESVLLDQLDLNISRQVDASKGKFDVGFTIEQIYGADAALLHANGLTTYSPSKILGAYTAGPERSPKNQYDLTQAFLTFAVPVGNGLTVTVGKFDTLLGYEVIDPTQNTFFSHSFLFTQIPLTQTGVLVGYNVMSGLTVTGGFTRGWDQALKDTNGSLDALGQIKYTQDKLTLILNASTGDQEPTGSGLNGWRTVFDAVAQYAYADNLTLAVNADYGFEPQVDAGSTGQWYGAAVYGTYKISQMFSVSGRAEWFDDQDGVAPVSFNPGVPNTYYELTLGVAIKPFPTNNIGSNLVIRPEVRLDYADKPTWVGDNSHDQLTAAIEAYFTF